MREHILKEIKRLAKASGDKPPGKKSFERETGIRESEWSGRYWARWGDACLEAGLIPNAVPERISEDFVLKCIAEACRRFGRVPTTAEFQLERRGNDEFPSAATIRKRFRTRTDLLSSLKDWCQRNNWTDVAAMNLSGDGIQRKSAAAAVVEGFVYLLQSGAHYKIGRSDDLERRVKSVSVALPESLRLVHAIRTDDPPGIEAYWHRRFAERRMNGEWFKLTPADLLAFKRRKFQ